MKGKPQKRSLVTILIFLVLGIIVLGGVFWRYKVAFKKTPGSSTVGNNNIGRVIFPSAGDTLSAGGEYTLQWNADKSQTNLAIFLIDASLESAGQSVSIVDRIYDVPNIGSFHYVVPEGLEPGKYKFQIGQLNSDYFQVVAKKEVKGGCPVKSLSATVSFGGAAGSVYGDFEIKNVSQAECTVYGENFIQLRYDSKIQNIKVNFSQPTEKVSFQLKPNESLLATARIENGPQCSSGIVPVDVSYRYVSENGQLVFSDSERKSVFMINSCKSSDEITLVDMSELSKAGQK